MIKPKYIHKDILDGLKKHGFLQNGSSWFSGWLQRNILDIYVAVRDDNDSIVEKPTLAWLLEPGWDVDPTSFELTLVSIVKGQKIGSVMAPHGFSDVDLYSGSAYGEIDPFSYKILRDPLEVKLEDLIPYESFIEQLKSKEIEV